MKRARIYREVSRKVTKNSPKTIEQKIKERKLALAKSIADSSSITIKQALSKVDFNLSLAALER